MTTECAKCGVFVYEYQQQYCDNCRDAMRARGKAKQLQEHDEMMKLKEQWREGDSLRSIRRRSNKNQRKKIKKL